MPEPVGPTGKALRCPYCESRYRIVDQQAVQAPAPTDDGTALAIVVAAVLILVFGLVIALVLIKSPDTLLDQPSLGEVSEVTKSIEHTAPDGVSQAVPDSAKEAMVEPSAVWRPSGTMPASGESYYVLGHVENTSPYPIDQVRIQVVLLDEAGTDKGVDFGFSARQRLAPGEVSPAKVLVNDPTPHVDRRYELQLRRSTYDRPRADGLRVDAMEPIFEDRRGWSFQGTVHHEGTVSARFVQLEVQALDEAGELVGLASTFVGGDGIAAGSSATFKTSPTKTMREPASFTYSVTGMPQEDAAP